MATCSWRACSAACSPAAGRRRARAAPRGRSSLLAAALVVGLALAFDLLFFTVDELPATVPVAVGLILVVLACRRAERSRRGVTVRGVPV